MDRSEGEFIVELLCRIEKKPALIGDVIGAIVSGVSAALEKEEVDRNIFEQAFYATEVIKDKSLCTDRRQNALKYIERANKLRSKAND